MKQLAGIGGDQYDEMEGLDDIAEMLKPDEARSPSQGEVRPMDERDVASIISSEIMQAMGSGSGGSSQLEADRRRALRYFYGKPFGNEVAGRSAVVLTEVADTIHWIMPSLMRMFAGGQDVFEVIPENESEREQAELATAYMNTVFWEEMDGFQVLYDWFFTALLEKNGFVTVQWENRTEPKMESYEGLLEEELNALLAEPRGLEVVEFEEGEPVQYPPTQDPNTGEMVESDPQPTYNVTLKQTKTVGRVRIRGISPDEFLITRTARTLDDDTTFVAERVRLTVSDLVAMGFPLDEVLTWPYDQTPEYEQTAIERRADETNFPITGAERKDAASRFLWVNNCYVRIDEDGDGYAELRHIIAIGDTGTKIVYDEYANFVPMASISASPVPHKFFGLSIADLVGDLQLIRSTLMRQLLDNLYLSNNQQMMVVPGQVMLDDLLTNRPGNMIRVDSVTDSMAPVVTPQLGPVAMDMMRYLDEIRETRIGVSRATQGLDASALNGTATGVNAMMAAGTARIDLIGRIIAVGMKRLGKLLLRTFKQHDNKGRMIQMRGNWVPVNPSVWSENFKVNIRVGLGVGAAAEVAQNLMAVLNLQKEVLAQGAANLVKPMDVYRAAAELTKAMGFRKADTFFTQPEENEWPEPAPDVQVLENQRRVQDDQSRNQIEAVRAQAEAGDKLALAEFRQAELAQKKELAILEMQNRLEIAKLQAKTQVEVAEENFEAAKENETDADE